MEHPVYIKTYAAPEIDRAEILRYARAGQPSPEIAELLEACLEEVRDQLTYRVCWQEYPVSDDGETLDLGFARVRSSGLRKRLAGCDRIILFAATIGIALDRLIARYGRLSPTKALLFQAIGAERIEALCDAFNRDISAEMQARGKHTVPRFSPGYGDLPLDLQRDIFRVLDCPRKIGLSLNGSLLMSPSKSVTAMIGVGDGTGNCHASAGCSTCENTSCDYRRPL